VRESAQFLASTPFAKQVKFGRQGHGPTGESASSKRETLPTDLWVINPTDGLQVTVERLTTRGTSEPGETTGGVQGKSGAPGTVARKRGGSMYSSSV
jgi:hypothetical protein